MISHKSKSVSIIIPSYNEVDYIGGCLIAVLASNYPNECFEILVVDGMSNDGTRNVVAEFTNTHGNVRLLDNPRRITPCALNIGIKASTGDVIIRMDAHALYSNDYISKCVDGLVRFGADNVGGSMITHPKDDTLIGRAIVLALTNRFGVGNSSFRTGTDQPKIVDTVFGGCFRREIFERIGLFNENLSSSQDIELNSRLRKSGGKIILVPDIVCHYYTRSDLRSFISNNFRNGIWAVMPIAFSEVFPVSWRHLVPLCFAGSLLVSAILSFNSSFFMWSLISILVLYLIVDISASSKIARKERDVVYYLLMPFIFFTLHISYGLGSVYGFAKLLFLKSFWKKCIKWANFGKMCCSDQEL